MSPVSRGAPARERVIAVLRDHLSGINASAVLRIADQRTGLSLDHAEPQQLEPLFAAIRDAVRLFIGNPTALVACHNQLDSARRDLEGVAPRGARTAPRRLEIASESDIVAARTVARELSAEIGFGAGDQLKIATVVSELARNIVNYAKRGHVELLRLPWPELGIQVLARDHGPGISDVDKILSGQYRSKHGMGMGLRGTKNLMDDMQIETAPGAGTTIRVRKFLR